MDTFTKESIQFFSALKRNNNRKWFEKNKERYEVSIKNPANLFLLNFAKEMKSEFPNLVIDKKSMYRIYRDTRFSKDKTPYKTHAGFLFYDRRFTKDESPAFYFGFDPTGFAFGFGVFRFLGTQRAIFRERVMNGKPSVEFTNIIKTLKKKKYVPRGLELKKYLKGLIQVIQMLNLLNIMDCMSSKKQIFYLFFIHLDLSNS